MRSGDSHPGPPADLSGRRPLILSTAQRWFRTHRRDHPPLSFAKEGLNRFDAPKGEYGILYVAADEYGAFIETFGQSTGCNMVTLASLDERCLSRIEAKRPLDLVDLAGSGGLARLGADGRLCAGDRQVARQWSLALRSHPCRPDGIHYPSRHDPARRTGALFEQVAPDLLVTDTIPWSAPRLAPLLGRILDTYGFALIGG